MPLFFVGAQMTCRVELDQPWFPLITGIAYIYIQLNEGIKTTLDYRTRWRSRKNGAVGVCVRVLGDPQSAPRRGRGDRVGNVIRRARRGEDVVTASGTCAESACGTG